MLQTGDLIRDLSVREVVAMIGSLYPNPLDIGEVLELTRLEQAANQRTQKLLGGQTRAAMTGLILVGLLPFAALGILIGTS